MAGLILKLRAHEQILVNGVVMQNGDRNARLIIKTPDANILRLRDAIHPDDADTPVKRVCYIAQLAVAVEVAPQQAATQLGVGIAQLQDALAGFDGIEHLDEAVAHLRDRNFYAVLRTLRRVLPIEEMLLARSGQAVPGQTGVGQAGERQSVGTDEPAGASVPGTGVPGATPGAAKAG